MSAPTELPAAKAEAARQAIKAREDGIKANAIRQGIEQERKRQEAATATLKAEHQGQIDGLKQAHIEELTRTASRERAVGHHRAAWLYAIPSLIIGGALTAMAILWAQDVIWATAARNFREQAMTGAILRGGEQP